VTMDTSRALAPSLRRAGLATVPKRKIVCALRIRNTPVKRYPRRKGSARALQVQLTVDDSGQLLLQLQHWSKQITDIPNTTLRS
jgi:hypothetical protein